MTAFEYLQFAALRQLGTAVIVRQRHLGEALQAVDVRHLLGVVLDGLHIFRHGSHQLYEYLGLQRQDAFLGTQNLVLVFL